MNAKKKDRIASLQSGSFLFPVYAFSGILSSRIAFAIA